MIIVSFNLCAGRSTRCIFDSACWARGLGLSAGVHDGAGAGAGAGDGDGDGVDADKDYVLQM
jgi:hypothetical protein